MGKPLAILIVEDSESDAELIVRQLLKANYDLIHERVETADQMRSALARRPWDLVISDYALPDFNATAALALHRQFAPDIPFIVISGAIGEETAAALMKAGAHDYLMKGNLSRLPPVIERSLEGAAEHRARRAAENALRDSEQHYRSLFNNMRNGLAYCRMIFDGNTPIDFTYLEVNEAFEKLTGLKNVAGRNVTEVIPGIRESAPELFEIYGNVARTGQPSRFETYISALNMWFSVSVYSPKQDHFVALFDVITERKKTENALRESRELYETLAEKSLVGVYVVQAGKFTFLNAHAALSAGYVPEELIGRVADSIVYQEDLKIVKQNARMMLRGERNTPYEFRIKTKDGSIRWVMETVNCIQFEGKPAILGNSVDITEQKAAEETRRAFEGKLQQMEKMEALGTLAGGIAHDFNNILSAIIGYTEIALLESKDESIGSYLEQVYASGLRAQDLVKQILTFSRKSELEMKPISLRTLVNEAFRMLRATIPSTISITQNIARTSTIMGNPTQIHQVIVNLATNAYQSMPEQGGILNVELSEEILNRDAVAISNFSPGKYVVLKVSDNGQGIPAEILDRIYEPFFTTKNPGEGTGMGLAVVHGIIKHHGGAITVKSDVGIGTTFTIYLPAVQSEADRSKERPTQVPYGSGRILFVDDEETLTILGRRILQGLGYDVESRTSSLEALEAFRANPDRYDLVITDQTMPNMTGISLCEAIVGIRPDIPVVLCTGFSEAATPERIEKAGIKALVTKPIVRHQLAETIYKLLNAHSAS